VEDLTARIARNRDGVVEASKAFLRGRMGREEYLSALERFRREQSEAVRQLLSMARQMDPVRRARTLMVVAVDNRLVALAQAIRSVMDGELGRWASLVLEERFSQAQPLQLPATQQVQETATPVAEAPEAPVEAPAGIGPGEPQEQAATAKPPSEALETAQETASLEEPETAAPEEPEAIAEPEPTAIAEAAPPAIAEPWSAPQQPSGEPPIAPEPEPAPQALQEALGEPPKPSPAEPEPQPAQPAEPVPARQEPAAQPVPPQEPPRTTIRVEGVRAAVARALGSLSQKPPTRGPVQVYRELDDLLALRDLSGLEEQLIFLAKLLLTYLMGEAPLDVARELSEDYGSKIRELAERGHRVREEVAARVLEAARMAEAREEVRDLALLASLAAGPGRPEGVRAWPSSSS
jgi:hypothetical protein